MARAATRSDQALGSSVSTRAALIVARMTPIELDQRMRRARRRGFPSDRPGREPAMAAGSLERIARQGGRMRLTFGAERGERDLAQG